MNRHLLVIDRVLALAAFRAAEEEASLMRARRLDAEEVGRRADRVAKFRRPAKGSVVSAGDVALPNGSAGRIRPS